MTMSDNKAMKDDDVPAEEPEGELDQAISDLRGVLEQDAAGSLDEAGADETGEQEDNPFDAGGISMDDFPETATTETDPLADNMAFGGDFSAEPAAGEPGQTTGATGSVANADIIMEIPVDVQIVLGKTRMKVSSLMSLDEGATISLDRKIGETVDIMVNGRMIGHGEITVLEDDETRLGVRLTEILGAGK